MLRARGPCTASTAQAADHVLDPDVETANETIEVGEVRLGRGQDELVDPRSRRTTPSSTTKPRSSHQAVYCARPGTQRPDVASEDAGQEDLGISPVDPVLVEQ